MSFASFFMNKVYTWLYIPRWTKYVQPLMELHCESLSVHCLARHFVHLCQSLPTTSSTPYVSCQLNVQRLTQFRHTFWNGLPIWLRHSSLSFKEAFVTSVIKKPGLDPTDAGSYWPISNLWILSKLLKRLMMHQPMAYLTSTDLFPPLQSGFRSGHSTESAMLHILSDIFLAVNRGDFAVVVLVDLPVAFNTAAGRLSWHPATESQVKVLGLLMSSWAGSGCTFSLGHNSSAAELQLLSFTIVSCSSGCRVPQGSVLGPVLFILYIAGLAALIE